MPRSGDGVWTDIPNITAVPGQTIESADWNNYRADLRDNEFNAARPITAGGTGATNAADALANLGGVGQSNFLDAYPIGSFFETATSLDATWLRRNGTLYDSADYPDLAAILPTLPDGIEWSSISTAATEIQGISIIDGTFVLASRSGVNTNIYNSSDGASYSLVATISNFSVDNVIYGNGIYLAVDGNGKVSVSNDGIVWGSPFFAIGSGSDGVTGAAFGNNRFVIVGTGGKISSSPDATSWSVETSGTTELLWSVRFINNVFVATGNNGTIVTSPDGDTWTIRTSGVTEDLFGSAFGSGLYVIVGESGRIITSATLTGWTTRTSGTSSALNDVVWSSSGFLAVGASGVARLSSNGTTWSASTTGVSATLVVVNFDPDQEERYFAGGGATLIQGIRTLPTQFRVPSDDPTYGWIKALEELP